VGVAFANVTKMRGRGDERHEEVGFILENP